MEEETINELLSFLTSPREDIKEETLKIILTIINSTNISSFISSNLLNIYYSFLLIPSLRLNTINLLNILLIEEQPLFNYKEIIFYLLNDLLLQRTRITISTTATQQQQQGQQEDDDKLLINISLCFLTNLTRIEEYNTAFIHEILRENKLNHFLDSFLNYNPQIEGEEVLIDYQSVDPWQYFANILCNICQDERILLFLLNRSNNYLQSLLKQVFLFSSSFSSSSFSLFSSSHRHFN